ncbi:hypothetical protein AAVH_28822 [Aphelenchoides avenae]|nr:hypothetical protein AAVH_28822 [Aphelenchus avenae]
MTAICRRLRLKHVVQTLAKLPRYSSSDEDAFKRFYTARSSRKQNVSTALRLNASQLEVLNVTFDPESLPSNVGEDSYKEYFRQGRVYLIGTSHGEEDW